MVERGRTPAPVLEQFNATVEPMHDRFVEPSRVVADRVVGVDEDLDRVAGELAVAVEALVHEPV